MLRRLMISYKTSIFLQCGPSHNILHQHTIEQTLGCICPAHMQYCIFIRLYYTIVTEERCTILCQYKKMSYLMLSHYGTKVRNDMLFGNVERSVPLQCWQQQRVKMRREEKKLQKQFLFFVYLYNISSSNIFFISWISSKHKGQNWR
jgi:hypothetical protein